MKGNVSDLGRLNADTDMNTLVCVQLEQELDMVLEQELNMVFDQDLDFFLLLLLLCHKFYISSVTSYTSYKCYTCYKATSSWIRSWIWFWSRSWIWSWSMTWIWFWRSCIFSCSFVTHFTFPL